MPNPHPLKRLKVSFNAPIQSHQIPAFRGAMIDLVGQENTLLFHNHLDDKRFRYGYPLIQYKYLHRQPTVVCIGEGVGEIHKFFQQENWKIRLHGEAMTLSVADLEMKELQLQTLPEDRTYSIWNWIALNDRSQSEYEQLDNLIERLQKLEQILGGNIVSMAKGIGWQIPERVNCKILSIDRTRSILLKKVKKKAFSLQFKTNVWLPNDIGLGRHVSLGFGTIWMVNEQ